MLKLLRFYILAGIGLGALALGIFLGLRIDLPATNIKARESVSLERIREAGELVTVIATVQAIITPEASTVFLGVETGKSTLTYRVLGEVRIGVNLERLTPDSVQREGSVTKIILPPPELFSVSPLQGETISIQNRGFWVDQDLPLSLRDQAEELSRAEIRRLVCANRDLAEKAKQRAEQVVKQVAGSPVIVQFQEGELCQSTDRS